MPTPPIRRKPRQPKYRVDEAYHRWPITGFTCTACGWPLDRAFARLHTHPTCATDPRRTP